MPDARLLLYDVFVALRAKGAALGTRDYIDALRSLESGFASWSEADLDDMDNSFGAVDHQRDFGYRARRKLTWLLQALWARTPSERALVQRMLTAIPPPPAPVVREFLLDIGETFDLTDAQTPPDPDFAARADAPLKSDTAGQARTMTSVKAKAQAKEKSKTSTADESSMSTAAHIGVSSDSGPGLSLPAFMDAMTPSAHQYEFTDDPPIKARELAMMWRRYRTQVRTEYSTEIDAAATTRRFAETGFVLEPAFAAKISNAARLTVLLDVSDYMQPWSSLVTAIAASVQPAYSRVRDLTLRYFSQAPFPLVWTDASRRNGQHVHDMLEASGGSAMLIVSDAQAASGDLRPRITRAIKELLAAHRERSAARIVWINPMPKRSWLPGSEQMMRDVGGACMLPLDRSSFLAAVDIMRGTKPI